MSGIIDLYKLGPQYKMGLEDGRRIADAEIARLREGLTAITKTRHGTLHCDLVKMAKAILEGDS